MQKYQNHAEDKGLFTFYLEQQSAEQLKENQMPTPNLQSKNSSSMILPSSRKRAINKTAKESPQSSSKEIVIKFLGNCHVPHYKKKLSLTKLTPNQQNIIAKNEVSQKSSRKTCFQEVKPEDRFCNDQIIEEEEINAWQSQREYEKFQKFRKNKNKQNRQGKLEKDEKEQIGFNQKSFSYNHKSLSLSPEERRNLFKVKLINIKTKSQSREGEENENSQNPKKIEIALPNISDKVLQNHYKLKILHQKKKPKSQVFMNLIKNQNNFLEINKKIKPKQRNYQKIVKVNLSKVPQNNIVDGWQKRKKLFINSLENKK